ncbi:MAG: hypothetical protein ACOX6X_05375 [Dethiobacteria bacterium]
MYEERWDKGRDRECGCRIKVEDSIVVIICGDFEIDRLKDTIGAALED